LGPGGAIERLDFDITNVARKREREHPLVTTFEWAPRSSIELETLQQCDEVGLVTKCFGPTGLDQRLPTS
jgi:hypothetical protein